MTATAALASLAVLVLVWAVPYARHPPRPSRVTLSAVLAVLLGASAAGPALRPAPRPGGGPPPPLVAPFVVP